MAEINTQGIFSLGQHRSRSLDNRISSRTRESYSEYGYTMFSGSDSNINRINYSNDSRTASPRAMGSVVDYNISTGNSNFGYSKNNYGSSLISRLDYRNDTLVLPSRLLDAISTRLVGVAAGTKDYGWFIGGLTTQISRINYSNDTAPTLTRGRELFPSTRGSGAGNINYAWIVGGDIGAFGGGSAALISSVRRFSYSNDLTTSRIRSFALSVTRLHSTTGNSNFGYFSGGQTSRNISNTTMNRIEYTNDLISPVLRGPMSAGSSYLSATGNLNFGYFIGGRIATGVSEFSKVERLDYSNDMSTCIIRGPLLRIHWRGSSVSASSFGGAPNTSNITTLPTQIQNNINYNLSNASTVPQKRALGSFGYFVGGTNGPTIFSTNTRIQFSNDSVVSTNRGPLSQNRWQHQTTGNSNFGYIAGGRVGIPSAIITTVDRVDYANDISGSIDRGPLSSASYYTRGCTSSSFAYFNQYTSISRLSYSDDSVTTVVRGNRVVGSNHYAISQNSNFAYYSGGGDIGGGNARSNIDRFQFSNDTSTTLNKGKLIFAKSESTAVGNNNFGYIGAARGVSPIQITFIERIDYSNDTNVASVRINLDTFRVANTGNSNFGYFSMGGRTAGDNIISSTDRLDYSNDVATTSRRGNSTVNYWFSRGLTNGRNS